MIDSREDDSSDTAEREQLNNIAHSVFGVVFDTDPEWEASRNIE